MKNEKISILIPCYNEVENVEAISRAVIEIFEKELSQYDYEILFIDNASYGGTRHKIENLCLKNKGNFYVTNFGQFIFPFYGMCQNDRAFYWVWPAQR